MSLTRLNLTLIYFLLLGYIFFDKSFAYIGIWPLYIGEIILATTLFTTLITGINIQVFRSPITRALLAYILWQVIIFIFFRTTNLIDALRDSVIWYYAIFAILVASWILRLGTIEQCLNWYGRWLPWFAIWAAPAFLISDHFRFSFPQIPGTDVTIFQIKSGDFAVHLAGITAFILLGLHRVYPRQKIYLQQIKNWFVFKDILCSVGVLLGLLATGSRNRGGLVSILLAIFIVTIFRPNNRLSRLALPIVVIMTLLIALDINIPTGGGRDVSLNQILTNLESVIGEGGGENLTGTVNWRKEWWSKIIDDIFSTDKFWHGVGYGESLAAPYGFSDNTGNRSPHNAFITILARSGVPGVFLWVCLIITTYFMLLRGYVGALRNNQQTQAKLNLWIMAYLAAFLMDMSVDVYLEGPQGGITFWCLMGFTIALTYTQKLNAVVKIEYSRKLRTMVPGRHNNH